MAMTGVYPVYSNKFKVGLEGRESSDEKMVSIAEMESFSVAIDGSVEEWTPMDSEGWIKRLTTGKGLTISLAGKRCVGDLGNDYVAAVAWKNGRECDSKFQWEFPDGAKLAFDCVINVTTPGGGDSTAVDGLEFDVMSSGKPIYTPATTPAA
ncbi:phage tail tube protein [Bittarella massiliensis (ex Durand et al. 2017)]|uniref:Phage major tail protein, TP901-1 family n=1 Tax=Bittarella massiliensis (ex Durand et al. 2017) TaxID=1720313 RepID=A0AAW5K5H4_9FIRM|nr:hypothetical protein [Bittarella massiliensis (ex Durand et al. 2017)]MCQ4948251.1 hypothetical protein [Bittarella massiliensis (ex Durand et al. 2017)]